MFTHKYTDTFDVARGGSSLDVPDDGFLARDFFVFFADPIFLFDLVIHDHLRVTVQDRILDKVTSE